MKRFIFGINVLMCFHNCGSVQKGGKKVTNGEDLLHKVTLNVAQTFYLWSWSVNMHFFQNANNFSRLTKFILFFSLLKDDDDNMHIW